MSLTKTDRETRQIVLDRFQAKVVPGKPALYKCAGCGDLFPSVALEIDHIQPEVDSTPEQRKDPANMQPLCNPKGVSRDKSCHRKKTAREATARAALNRPARDWTPVVVYGGLGAWSAGVGYSLLDAHPLWLPTQWTMGCVAASGIGFLTYLVQNGFRHRAPLERIPPERVSSSTPEAEPALDVARITEAVREKVGPKGQVTVTVASIDAFTISYAGTGFADHKDDDRYDLVQRVTAKIGDRWKPEWDTRNDRVRLTRRPALPKIIHHPGLDPDRPWHVLPIADGVAFDLMVTSHLLIVGETNSGKTAMLRAIIAAADDSARRHDNVKTILVDPKRIEMIGFKTWAGVRRVITKPLDLWDIAFEIRDEMDRRYTAYEERGVPLDSHDKWICIFDEFAEYFQRVFDIWVSGMKDENGDPYKRPGEKQPSPITVIMAIISLARKCGIHLILSTQSPDANLFGKSGNRQNMAGRATVGAIDAVRALMMYGDSSVGRDIPSSAKGRATVQIGDGEPVEVQTFFVPDPADADPNYNNTAEDWATLLRLGMPRVLLPEAFAGQV